MSGASMASLADRGLVSVTGEDAGKLLGGLITNDIDLLDSQPAIYAGLLSPQGKLLCDFIVVRSRGGYLLDVAEDRAGDLAKRLTMYRLRARAVIEVLSASHTVVAYWGGAIEEGDGAGQQPLTVYKDPRHPELGWRAVLAQRPEDRSAATAGNELAQAYHAHRIALGIPEGGKDWDFGDAFPHEANFDLLNGVSFTKGCYVGQEIVARMEHRGTVRKRIARVTGAAVLPTSRPDVMSGDVVIGRLGSVVGHTGLALVRLDRVIEALDKGIPISADGIALTVDAGKVARQREVMAGKAAQP